MPTIVDGDLSTDAELSTAVRVSVMRLARRMRSQDADNSLTITQLAALGTLEGHGALSPRELAAREKVQPPSMTRVIDQLEDRGLAVRRPHPSDGRQVLVEISEAGRVLLRNDRHRREAWLASRLKELAPEERELLRAAAALLERLAQS